MRPVVAAWLGFCMVVSGVPAAHAACGGDCNGDGSVTVDEIVTGVSVALGAASASNCSAFDADADGQVTIDEIVAAVTFALGGCPPVDATPTSTATASPNEPTPTPEPRPSVPPGCNNSNGYTRVLISDASGTNGYTELGEPLHLFGVNGADLASVRGITSTSVTCPTSLDTPIVTLTAGVSGYAMPMAPGNVYELHASPIFAPPAILITTVVYGERLATDPLRGRGWVADSGTMTIDAFDGQTATITLDAHMVPQPTSAGTGTFRMRATVIVDRLGRN